MNDAFSPGQTRQEVFRRVRRCHSKLGAERISREIRSWFNSQRRLDRRRLHATQLSAIEVMLTALEQRLASDFEAIERCDELESLFEECAAFDRRVVWLERIWRFFQSKFDQRQTSFGDVLAAADEVVWSCYSQVFERAEALGVPLRRGPAPLPFIESRYSPEAFPSELVPPDLKSEIETWLLRDFLNQMPISVVRLPPICCSAPWWLVFLAHEVGHHVQYDLLPKRQLVATYREAIEGAVRKQTGSDPEALRWGSWSKEIFADVFSVLCMGQWAVRAMVELEMRSPDGMVLERSGYPPARTRLILLALTADRLSRSNVGADVLSDFMPVERDATVEAVIDAALGKLPGLNHSLPELFDFDPNIFIETIPAWREKLIEQSEDVPNAELKSARVLVGAALSAWDHVAGREQDKALGPAVQDLAKRTISTIIASAVEGERAASEEIDTYEIAKALTAAAWGATR